MSVYTSILRRLESGELRDKGIGQFDSSCIAFQNQSAISALSCKVKGIHMHDEHHGK
jgi:hypothetical protein